MFSGWIWEIHETYFLYRFFEDGENGTLSEEDVLYQPAYVLSGYRIEYRGVVNGMAVVFYINDESGDLIDFQYFTDPGSSVVQVVRGSGISYKKVLVNGKSAVLHLEEGETNVLVWVNEENRLAFTFSGVPGGEELIKMAESVRAIPRGQFFRPAWLSEGYYEVSAKDCPIKGLGLPHGLEVGESVLSYENGKDGHLTVACAHEFEITGLRPDRCEADAVSVQVGETPAFLFLDREKNHHLVWADEDSGVFFWISGPFTGEELVRIGESLESFDAPPLPAVRHPSVLTGEELPEVTESMRITEKPEV